MFGNRMILSDAEQYDMFTRLLHIQTVFHTRLCIEDTTVMWLPEE